MKTEALRARSSDDLESVRVKVATISLGSNTITRVSRKPRPVHHEGLPGITTVFSSEFDEGGRRIAAHDGRRVGVTTDRIRQRACATPDIQPVNAARDPQPGDELGREEAAPSAHEALVARPSSPLVPNVAHGLRLSLSLSGCLTAYQSPAGQRQVHWLV